VLSLSLVKGKKWGNPSTSEGMTLYLTDLSIRGANQINDAKQVAQIIPTPTIQRHEDNVIYTTGTSKLVINGTNFRQKGLKLMFNPPLEQDTDYLVSVKSSTMMVLTRTSGAKWRSEPGPLKLARIDTGGGMLRIDPTYGGITVAEVQADLGAHGVTVESNSRQVLYQSSADLTILGEGFNTDSNTLRFHNGLRGKGVNYTTMEHTPTQLKLHLGDSSKWRANPANLPGPLVLLAVDAGAGFVPVGPTEAKKGRVVATVFEDPVVAHSTQAIFQSHTHEVWITGTGFTRGQYNTELNFFPPIDVGADVSVVVYNRTHIKLTLLEGKKWINDVSEPGTALKIKGIDTGAGAKMVDVQIALVKPDADDHESGVTVKRSTQSMYQTAAIKKLVIEGAGFTRDTTLTFLPALTKDEDYTQQFDSDSKLTLSLKKQKKWRFEGGSLLVKEIDVGDNNGAIPVGSGGQGIQVASILQDPDIEESERIIFESHTRRLVVRGSGFSLEGTELTLNPTKRSSYEIESLEQTEIVFKLNEGSKWAEVDEGKFVHIYVQKIDTGAGEVIMDGDGVVIAKVESDIDDNHCDDSCEWAIDGVCDDGSSKGRFWYDDDYGGFYGYDDDYYGYGYDYYYGDDEFLAPVCDEGTDCTDCGGPPTSEQKVECDNSCQWANDGFCDDTRTSGLCDLGTDCHDCGPVSNSNYSNWDDDGWWDDDDSYWEVDDSMNYGTGRSEHTVSGGAGAGGVFMVMLESLVYVVGALICGGGTYVALKWYKGQGDLPYVLAPTSDPSTEMPRRGASSSVPITPDVHYT